MEGFLSGVLLVVGAAGNYVLGGGVAFVDADDAEAEHGVGKDIADERERAGLAWEGHQEGGWNVDESDDADMGDFDVLTEGDGNS